MSSVKGMSDEMTKLAEIQDGLNTELEKIRVELNVKNSQKLEFDTVQNNLSISKIF